MIGALSGFSPYSSYSTQNQYNPYRTQNSQQAQGAGKTLVATAHKAAQPELPVQPVRPATPVTEGASDALAFAIRQGADPVEMAVRMRIQYADNPAQAGQPAAQGAQGASLIPGQAASAADPMAQGVQGDPAGVEGVQKAVEEGQCETCEERKYQDGSDDAGVSYQTPTHIDPDQAPAAVRGHEQEHVVREQAKAGREDRKVVSQSVSLHTDICPECGRVYVSGGTTRTTTAAVQEQPQPEQQEDPSRPTAFSAIA